MACDGNAEVENVRVGESLLGSGVELDILGRKHVQNDPPNSRSTKLGNKSITQR